LLSQQDANVLAHFATDGSTGVHSGFIAQGNVRMPDLRAIRITALPFKDPLIAPVMLDNKLELNWWLNQYRTEKSPLKLWSGTSNPRDMLRKYKELVEQLDENMLLQSITTKVGKSSFGFDTRASRDALAIGYSQRESGDASVLYPATEFLCALGLQNFRPIFDLTYFAWRRPIPICLAHAAAVQEAPGLDQDAYAMSIEFVGQGLRAVDKVTRVSANLSRPAAVSGFA
jgi:CRISPR-associated protein Csb3